jgi:osmotically-inducible protein OsmY
MGKLYPCRLAALLAVLMVGGLGCSNQDADRLARAARCVGEKMETLTGGADGQLAGWQVVKANVNELTLDTRVSARLRWEKSLAGSNIQVTARDGVVELKGTVRDLSQRRRAVELAESTVGTEKVNDQLEVPTAAP